MSPLISRLAILLSFMAVGAALAALSGQSAVGLAAGAVLWLALDSWRALRFVNWLARIRDNPATPPPRFFGIRKEASERVQRLLRKQALEAAEHESRLHNMQSALQASPNGVIILDEQEHIEWCNRMACEHFGLDARRDLNQRVTHLLRAPTLVKSLAARDFDEAVTLESPLSTAARPLRLEARLFPYGQGRLLMLSRDITVIEQAEAMRRDFVANVSHEIRTPLTVLTGFIETLQNLPLDEDARANTLKRMAQQAARMKTLVDDLLTLSRIEGSASPDEREWTPVRALLQRCEADARALSANLSANLSGQDAPRHEFVFEGVAVAGEIAGSAKELQSALFNIINNAIRYTPPGGRIEVRWTPEPDGGARFSVRDSGPGIAPEHIPRLTERFYRVDSDRSRASGGTGLGLSIVKHVLQRHDAALRIESAPGQGACFTATFPASRLRAAPATAAD
ncbi:phosphate regulon sensor histidine kinase PhoR [Betaproteobacteria bacterium]|nr:phosphate regulon sensor histidine kinase PhoR [Betaproteobacteria bacterium]